MQEPIPGTQLARLGIGKLCNTLWLSVTARGIKNANHAEGDPPLGAVKIDQQLKFAALITKAVQLRGPVCFQHYSWFLQSKLNMRHSPFSSTCHFIMQKYRCVTLLHL